MRTVTITRVPALAGFALQYFCFLDTDPAPFAGKMEYRDFLALAQEHDPAALRNGQTVSRGLDGREHTVMAVIWTQQGNRIVPPLAIEAGEADVSFKLITNYNGFDVLEYGLVRDE